MTKATSGADRKAQELNIFHDVAKALTSSLDLDSILQTIMEKMAERDRRRQGCGSPEERSAQSWRRDCRMGRQAW